MKRLDFDTFCLLDDAKSENTYDWNFEQFREYRESLGVTRETVIPCEFLQDMLEYRFLEYNPADYGLYGKFSEVSERVKQAIARGKDLRWNDFNAHKAGRRDLSYGRKAVEKKTGAGDWLVSYQSCTVDSIVREYSRKTSLIHWQVEDLDIDITCQWNQLMEYLAGYTRKVGGPAMGAAYWFKNKVKPTEDGDRWIVEIQTYRTSEKKVEYLRNCPWNNK